MANSLAVPNAAIAKKPRAIVQVAKKVAPKVANVARVAGRGLARVTRSAGGMALSGARRGGRKLAAVAKENWKTAVLNEGLGLGSHALTYFLDRKAKTSYQRAFADNPFLTAITKPSNIMLVFEALGLMFTKGNVRKVMREILRGTLHAKLSGTLTSIAPETAMKGTDAAGWDVDETQETQGVDVPDEAEGVDVPDEAEGVDDAPEPEEPKAG